jgi:cyclic pyranopterin phosphate synthase
MQKKRLLDFDEILQIARAFVDLGVQKIRLTGGEPLVRRDLSVLVARLAELRVHDLCLTTNGSLLSEQAPALKAAGLRRVTVSLDALDQATFHRVTDAHVPLSKVLRGIDVARRHGLLPLKINMVVQRGLNDHAILPMAAWARSEGLELRFIEYMDVGCSNGWRERDVVSAREIRDRVHALWPMELVGSADPNETAERFRYLDGRAEVGFIAAVTQPFCRGCTRARVSSRGELYPCLFATTGVDLAAPLRQGEDVRHIIAETWQGRSDRYSELRSTIERQQARPEMSAIGG